VSEAAIATRSAILRDVVVAGLVWHAAARHIKDADQIWGRLCWPAGALHLRMARQFGIDGGEGRFGNRRRQSDRPAAAAPPRRQQRLQQVCCGVIVVEFADRKGLGGLEESPGEPVNFQCPDSVSS